MTGRPFALVDAFVTERPFSGNPAGVMMLDDYPDDAWLLAVADELHQAETAFLVPTGEEGVFRLRWFTPVTEVELCGHATLASAHWLWELGVVPTGTTAAFDTRSGRLEARRDGELVVLDFPEVPATAAEPPAGLAAALAGATPTWVGVTEHEDPEEHNLLVVLDSEDAVRRLQPDLAAVAALPAGGLIVTARGGPGVVSRYFAPRHGIPEDAVTGSAHCTIGPHWRDELGDTIEAEQASRRGGLLTAVTSGSGRVGLKGRARTAASGLLL